MPLPCYSLAKGPVLFVVVFQPDAPLHSLKGKIVRTLKTLLGSAFRLKAHRRSLRSVSQVVGRRRLSVSFCAAAAWYVVRC